MSVLGPGWFCRRCGSGLENQVKISRFGGKVGMSQAL
jgi:hypothetical protein